MLVGCVTCRRPLHAHNKLRMTAYCPGYTSAPFTELVEQYPDHTVYPFKDFRVEWGPIFHRGRLDGSARVIVIGQDPGQHENVLRRILTGEAGRRVQGLLAKLGVFESYVLINALLYSVASGKGASYVEKPAIRAYRDLWLDAILAPGQIEAVVTFGTMARNAWNGYAQRREVPSSIAVAHLTHPTFPMSAGGDATEIAANTQKMLTQWTKALPILHTALRHPDIVVDRPVPYGTRFKPSDKANIPSRDLPAGTPAWMYANDGWAKRLGKTPTNKRRNITLTVPSRVIP